MNKTSKRINNTSTSSCRCVLHGFLPLQELSSAKKHSVVQELSFAKKHSVPSTLHGAVCYSILSTCFLCIWPHWILWNVSLWKVSRSTEYVFLPPRCRRQGFQWTPHDWCPSLPPRSGAAALSAGSTGPWWLSWSSQSLRWCGGQRPLVCWPVGECLCTPDSCLGSLYDGISTGICTNMYKCMY